MDITVTTESVRINTESLNLVREVKKHTGFPIAKFIEQAIAEKVKRLPKKTKEKMGIYAVERH